jgi:hypothetical protein
MRQYWLKIAASAFGIFAVGMLLITTVRGVKSKVTSTLNSSDPIPIPLIGLVPFRLDSQKLGSLQRVEFLRSDPHHVSGVRVVVSLPESVGADRLRACQIALDDVDNINEKTTFRCQALGAIPAGIVPFGELALSGRPETFPLLLPEKAVKELQQTEIRLDHSGLHINNPHDQAALARTDSMRDALSERIDARTDSIDQLKDRAGELEDSATSLAAAGRRRVQRAADSVRVVMRSMVDRLKADEASLKAFDGSNGIREVQIDSLSRLGPELSDSIRRAVARQVRAAKAEARHHRTEVQVEVAPPAPPVAPPAVKP